MTSSLTPGCRLIRAAPFRHCRNQPVIMSIEHADLPMPPSSFTANRLGVPKERNHYFYDGAGQFADQGTTGSAPPRDPGRPERRRYRSDNQAGSKGSRAAAWMRIVLDTNVPVSAVLKLNSYRFSPFAELIRRLAQVRRNRAGDFERACAAAHRAVTIPSFRQDLAKLPARTELIANSRTSSNATPSRETARRPLSLGNCGRETRFRSSQFAAAAAPASTGLGSNRQPSAGLGLVDQYLTDETRVRWAGLGGKPPFAPPPSISRGMPISD